MKVKALVSFAGKVSMGLNEVKVIEDQDIYEDLIRAGYVEDVEEVNTKTKKSEVPPGDVEKNEPEQIQVLESDKEDGTTDSKEEEPKQTKKSPASKKKVIANEN